MKWLAFILAFYVLLLSGIPCKADDDCCMDEIALQAAGPGKHKQEADHKPISPCSPFFACGACHGAVIPELTLAFQVVTVPRTKLFFFYVEQPLFKFPSTIWQPPKFTT